MKQFILRVYEPCVYVIEADSYQEAQKKAVARWRREDHTAWLEPEVEVIREDDLTPEYWDSVDAAIDDYKERGM